MAIKIVQGFVGKDGPDQKVLDVQQQSQRNAQSPQSVLQQTVAKAAQSTDGTDAVVTALRSVKPGAPGKGESIKSDSEAKEVARDVSEKIRDDKDEAGAAHDGLSTSRSGTVLLN